MYALIQDYGKELFSLIVPIVTFFVKEAFKPKASLMITERHASSFLLNESYVTMGGVTVTAPNVLIRNRTVLIRNTGKEAAKNIEILFNWKPMFNIWPHRDYTTNTLPDGRFVFKMDSIGPKEELNIELLAIAEEYPALTNARCDSGPITWKDTVHIVKVPKAQIVTFVTLMWIGFAAAIYLSISLLQFLVLKT